MPVKLVRHTTPLVTPNTCYGVTDLDVAETFIEECAVTLAQLEAVDHVVSSPLQRCLKLASRIADKFNIARSIDERIVELDFGTWEGISWDEIPRDELDAWAADLLNAKPHGGESVAELRARAMEAVTDYSVRPGHIVLVTHSGVIRSVMSGGDTIEDFSTSVAFGGVIDYDHCQDD